MSGHKASNAGTAVLAHANMQEHHRKLVQVMRFKLQEGESATSSVGEGDPT
jgi:hypothetical protein